MIKPIKKLLVFTLIAGTSFASAGFSRNNLFNPYDILLYKPMPEGACFDFDIAYEGAFKEYAYQADPDDRFFVEDIEHVSVFRRKANVLQIWNTEQNVFSALSGAEQSSRQARDAQLFNIRQQKINPRLIALGDLSVPMNLMLSSRFSLPHNFTLGIYLPVIMAELKHVTWHAERNEEGFLPDDATFNGKINDFLSKLERDGDINLRDGWKRHGVGDLSALLWWWRTYPQAKQWLKSVKVGARGGLSFPTGSKGDIDKIFPFAFGYCGGTGLVFGGTLELGLGRHMKLGIDGEFLNLFGATQERRIQTEPTQTDLIFLQKAKVHIDPGFTQHYTLWLKFAELLGGGFSTMLAYQHTRQHEDTLILDKPLFDTRIVNAAESLQDWTTHSLAWFLNYDTCTMADQKVAPGLSFFIKHGFNGKRAILFDTIGFQLNLSF